MFTLARYFPYLLNRAGSRIAVAFSAELASFGIALPAWRVLAVLLDAPALEMGALKMGDLARLTAIELSTLTRTVDGMEAQGLVRRRRDPEDARAVRLAASARGRALGRKIVPLALRYEAIALAGFSAEEQAQLEAMLVRVFSNMDRLPPVLSTTAAARARARRGRRG